MIRLRRGAYPLTGNRPQPVVSNGRARDWRRAVSRMCVTSVTATPGADARNNRLELWLNPTIESERALAINRTGWDRVAPIFHGGTALPEYGPLAHTEDTVHLLELPPDLRALELGCGSGHSLRYLAERGACELWGLDLSPVQIAFARETLRPVAERVRLIVSPMEVNPGIPLGNFDLVF